MSLYPSLSDTRLARNAAAEVPPVKAAPVEAAPEVVSAAPTSPASSRSGHSDYHHHTEDGWMGTGAYDDPVRDAVLGAIVVIGAFVGLCVLGASGVVQ